MWHKVSHTTPGTNYWFQKARNHFIIMRRYATAAQWFTFFLLFPIIFFKAVLYQRRNGHMANLFHMVRGLFSNLHLKP
jgi:hypothetical protein